MGTHQRLLLNQIGFTADTQTLNIPADNVKDLEIGFIAQDTLGAATVLKMKDNFDEVLVTLGGHQICKVLFHDLVAYNVMALANFPQVVLGGDTNYLCCFGGIKLPLHVTKLGPDGVHRSLMTQFTFGTNAAELSTETISVAYKYQDRPFPLHFAYQYEQKLGAADLRWEGLARTGATLQGLVIYNEMEDVAAANILGEIAELDVLIDDREVYTTNWATLKVHHSPWNQFDVAAGTPIDYNDAGMSDQIAHHYKYIEFEEPWRADKLAVITRNTCAAWTGSNGTCRLLGIYAEK